MILAAREKALRLDAVFTLPQLVPLLGRAFSTDLPLQRLLALANLGTQIKVEDVQLRVIDESLTIPYVAPDGAQVLLPRLEQIRALIGQLFDDRPTLAGFQESGVSEARIVVRADVGRPGLAEEVASLLQRRGYDAWVEDDGIQIEAAGTFIASRRDVAGGFADAGCFVLRAPDVGVYC